MIERLDRKAASWPVPIRATYLVIKWGLVALGGYLLVALWYERLILDHW